MNLIILLIFWGLGFGGLGFGVGVWGLGLWPRTIPQYLGDWWGMMEGLVFDWNFGIWSFEFGVWQVNVSDLANSKKYVPIKVFTEVCKAIGYSFISLVPSRRTSCMPLCKHRQICAKLFLKNHEISKSQIFDFVQKKFLACSRFLMSKHECCGATLDEWNKGIPG